MDPAEARTQAVARGVRSSLASSLVLLIAVVSSFSVSSAKLLNSIQAGSTQEPDAPLFSNPPTDQEILVCGVLPQPLAPVGRPTGAADSRALGAALTQYRNAVQGGAMPDAVDPLTDFLNSHPRSRWRVALYLNLGIIYRQTGHMTKAINAWQRAWDLSKHATEPNARALADYAVGQLAEFEAYLGRMETLAPLLAEVKGRPMHGAGAAYISSASEGLAEMRTRPQDAFRCGPMALHRICVLQKRTDGVMTLENSRSTTRGTSLVQVVELAHKVGLAYQMAYRESGAVLIVPAVMHWKVGHFAAITKESGAFYQVEDPTFGENIRVSRATLDEEGSGYFVVPGGALPKGWRPVSRTEGERIWGRGNTGGQAPAIVGAILAFAQCALGLGMTAANAQASTVSLALHDVPLKYRVPKGPAVTFELFYAHRDTQQPAIFTYTNFGPKWTSNWISYFTNNIQTNNTVTLYGPGGGIATYVPSGDLTPTGGIIFVPGRDDQALVTSLVSSGKTVGFTRELPDGSIQTFSRALGANQFFLTSLADPQGNKVILTYDGSNRITTITDAAGEKTTLTYSLAGDIYKVTRVADPFGRFATFTYGSSGQLASITDTLGITSSYTYLFDSGDFIKTLTTPYGVSTFTYGDSTTDYRLGTTIFLTMTDPLGQTERVEFRQQAPGIPDSDPANTVPVGMTTSNVFLSSRDVFVWDAHQLALATLPDGEYDYTKARMLHFLHDSNFGLTSGVLDSVKEPLENRVWMSYPGSGLGVGSSNLPSAIGRVLDDGSTQLWTYQRNSFGHVVQSLDPAGRQRTYTYAANAIDLLSTANTTSGANQLLQSATYNSQHEPLTVTDASGQVTKYTYNAAGQLLTTTDALNETTSYAYGATGLPVSATQPAISPPVNTTTKLGFDAMNRISSITDPQGYLVTFTHDTADRLTAITYPDATSVRFAYNLLDLASQTDRLNRTSKYSYDALRRRIKTTDPLGHITTKGYCNCNSVSTITDPKGNVTSFTYDLEDRLVTKTFADNTRITTVYENTTSRIRRTTDALGQNTLYTYNLDDTLRAQSYTNAVHATPAVSLVWDPAFSRILSITDGTGKTTFAYNAVASPPKLGATRVATITGPNGDNQAFTYDALGRAAQVTIDGAVSQYTFDPLGRVSAETNPLDTFTTTYMGASPSPLTIQSMAGPSSQYTYFGATRDDRLSSISNKSHGGTLLSDFGYGYDSQGEVTSNIIQAQLPGTVTRTMSYDAAAQLTHLAASGGGINYSFGYDAAANRTSETAGSTTTGFAYNTVNALTSPGPATYDGAGEPLTLGNSTYQWDAAGRLISVTNGTSTTRFAYDGAGRRTRITMVSGSTVTSDKLYFWCGATFPCVEKDAVTHAVTKRYFYQGMRLNGQALYYARDGLGSVRQMVNAAGTITASYDYDPYGVRTRVSGAQNSDFGFAGLFHESQSGLDLALFRPYNSGLGRWLSRDPIGEVGGLNLYAYAANNPQTVLDPLGLCPVPGFLSGLFGQFVRLWKAPSYAQAMARWVAAQERWAALSDLRGEVLAAAENGYATEAEWEAATITNELVLEETAPVVAAAEAEVTAAWAGVELASTAALVGTGAAVVGGVAILAGMAYWAYQYEHSTPPPPPLTRPAGVPISG